MASSRADLLYKRALEYARQRFPVVWMQRDSYGVRRPIGKLSCYHATCDTDYLKRTFDFWSKHREPVSAFALLLGPQSSLWCLDVDAKHDRDGLAQLAELEAWHGAVGNCRQRTPSGGLHILFAHDPRLEGCRNRDCLLGTGTSLRFGLEAKLHGSLAIQAPSDFGKGRYRYVKGQDLLDVEPAPAPDWLIDLVLHPPAQDVRRRIRERRYRHLDRPRKRRRYSGRDLNLKVTCDLISRLQPGEQYSQVNALCFSCGLKKGYRSDDAAALLGAATRMINQAGEPPWREHQLRRIIETALRDGSIKRNRQ